MSLEQWGGVRAAGACGGHQLVGVWSAMAVGGNPTGNDCMAGQKRSGGVDLLWEQGGKNEFLKSGDFEEGGRRGGWKRQRHVRRGPIPAHRGERDTGRGGDFPFLIPLSAHLHSSSSLHLRRFPPSSQGQFPDLSLIPDSLLSDLGPLVFL